MYCTLKLSDSLLVEITADGAKFSEGWLTGKEVQTLAKLWPIIEDKIKFYERKK
jgi:hypothetical protein